MFSHPTNKKIPRPSRTGVGRKNRGEIEIELWGWGEDLNAGSNMEQRLKKERAKIELTPQEPK